MSYINRPSDEDYDYGSVWKPKAASSPRAPSATKAYWERAIERAMSKLEVLEQFGDDEYEEGAVIRFDYQFAEGGKMYAYAAIKCAGLWYSTGPKAPKAYTWEQLIDFWAQAKNTIEIWYVSEYMAH